MNTYTEGLLLVDANEEVEEADDELEELADDVALKVGEELGLRELEVEMGTKDDEEVAEEDGGVLEPLAESVDTEEEKMGRLEGTPARATSV